MAALVKWLKQAVSKIADPDRERRVALQADALHHQLAAQGAAFQLQPTLQRLQVDPSEATEICETIYQRMLAATWLDWQVSQEERTGLEWASRALGITTKRAQELNWHAGFAQFQRFLGRAMEDGVISADESAWLGRIAAGMGTSVAELVRSYFANEGTSFLRGVFVAIAEDGAIENSEWQHLLATTSRLGLNRQDLATAIEPHARQFVERVLADAKADECLSAEEDRALAWVQQNLPLSPDFRSYIASEIDELRTFTQIRQGRIPSLPPPMGVELRAGEIVHFHGTATFKQAKSRRSGPVVESHSGVLTITDARAVFASSTKALSLNHRQVVAVRPIQPGVEVQTPVKNAAGWYEFPSRTRLTYAIYLTAVRRANQTVVEQVDGTNVRHIPRDVRQRVWQRYGGRCADCQSNQYLEYDHIIPVAKGGSNAEANVQLLCRGCNLKKSDHI
jgi:hypothetical protein